MKSRSPGNRRTIHPRASGCDIRGIISVGTVVVFGDGKTVNDVL